MLCLFFYYKYLHLGGRKGVLVKTRSFEPTEVSQYQQLLEGQGNHLLINVLVFQKSFTVG